MYASKSKKLHAGNTSLMSDNIARGKKSDRVNDKGYGEKAGSENYKVVAKVRIPSQSKKYYPKKKKNMKDQII